MDVLMLILIVLSVIFIIGGLYIASLSFSNASSKVKAPVTEPEVEATRPQARIGRGGTVRMRQRRRQVTEPETALNRDEARASHEREREGEGEGEEENDNENENENDTRELTKRELKKKQKEAKRQSELAARESRAEKSEIYFEKQKKKEEEREEEERNKADEIKKRKEKEEKEGEEELEKWKNMFSVENEGSTEEIVQEEDQGLLSRFVEYIQRNKCVDLEDLGAEFGLRTQDVIGRVQALEQMGRLTGVMDDRGKFIFISLEEMKAIAGYIKQKGRVSIAHLASKSNEFVDLEPKSVIDFDYQEENEEMETIDEETRRNDEEKRRIDEEKHIEDSY